jgi:hypothetical protein
VETRSVHRIFGRGASKGSNALAETMDMTVRAAKGHSAVRGGR